MPDILGQATAGIGVGKVKPDVACMLLSGGRPRNLLHGGMEQAKSLLWGCAGALLKVSASR